jgi:hypothetical protein
MKQIPAENNLRQNDGLVSMLKASHCVFRIVRHLISGSGDAVSSGPVGVVDAVDGAVVGARVRVGAE